MCRFVDSQWVGGTSNGLEGTHLGCRGGGGGILIYIDEFQIKCTTFYVVLYCIVLCCVVLHCMVYHIISYHIISYYII